MKPTIVEVSDGTVREQRFQSGDVVRRVRCRLVSGDLVMACELSPPDEERGTSIPVGAYILDPNDYRVSEYGAPRIARDARLAPLTRGYIDELEKLLADGSGGGARRK